MASRRYIISLLVFSVIFAVIFVTSFRNQPEGVRHPNNLHKTMPADHVALDTSTLTGPAIASKLGNETAKAELGRAAWMVLHTTFSRFPDNPSQDEKTTLQTFIHTFQRVYPCGECAEHFRTILDKYPPQVSSRSAAAAWGCHVHNEVNKSLNKGLFDCTNIGDFYDCGCAEDEGTEKTTAPPSETQSMQNDKPQMSAGRLEKITGANGRDFDMDVLSGVRPLELEKESSARGG